MSFNSGWMCKQCGPVKESKKRSINKVQFDCCKNCNEVVTKWERPINERAGHCGNCGNASFKLAMFRSDLLRKCKQCGEVYNTDKREVKRKGAKEFEYKPNKQNKCI